jgi:archaellum component FlaC
MSDQADTLPTLETILAEMRAGFKGVNQRLDRIESRVSAVEHQLEQMDIRADRLEGTINKTLSETMYLRADIKEFRYEFNEFRSQFKQPA